MISAKDLYLLYFGRPNRYGRYYTWKYEYPNIHTSKFSIKNTHQIYPNIFKVNLSYDITMNINSPIVNGFSVIYPRQQYTGEHTYYACTVQYYLRMFAKYHPQVQGFSDDTLNLYTFEDVVPNEQKILCNHNLRYVSWNNVSHSINDLSSLVLFYFTKKPARDNTIESKMEEFFRGLTVERIRDLFYVIYDSSFSWHLTYPTPIPILDICDDVEKGKFWAKQISKNGTGSVRGVLTSKRADGENLYVSYQKYLTPRYNVNDLNETYSDSTEIIDIIDTIHRRKVRKFEREYDPYFWEDEAKSYKRKVVYTLLKEQYDDYLLSLEE